MSQRLKNLISYGMVSLIAAGCLHICVDTIDIFTTIYINERLDNDR